MKWGILVHDKDGSYMQPVHGGEAFQVNYTKGQIYGDCSVGQEASSEKLAERGLIFIKVAERFDPKRHNFDKVTLEATDKITNLSIVEKLE